MYWPLYLIGGALVAFWLLWRYKNRRMIQMGNKMPGPPTIPLLGNALMFMCQPEAFIKVLKDLMAEYGNVTRFWLGPDLNIVISNPDDIKLLLSNTKTSIKGPQYKYMADVLGGGILSGSGPTWRRHRKIANPNYGKRAIEGYSEVFNQEVDLLLNKLRSMPREQFNVYEHVVRTTSYAVCRTLMGLTKDQTMKLPHIEELIDTSPCLYDIVFRRMTKWYLQIDPVFWMTSDHYSQKNFVKMMTDFCEVILQHRTERLKTLEDSKRDLMNSEDDSSVNTELSVIDRFLLSQELDKDELVQETFTIFTSSQEATAKISSYILLMMAYHPKCQEKLFAEIKNIIGDEDRYVTDDDLKRMPYLEMVFKEVLRLYPIGAMLQRTINEDIAISNYTLPAGCSFVAPIFHLHRDPRFWTEPDRFDPERFNPENVKTRNPNAYIPFSLGQMDCLGRFFGTKLVKTLCVRVLREFELSSTETYDDLRVIISISVASLNGFPIILNPRKK
ncbi:cytochrome P450 4C1-like [Spodoptera litura]|uniref:Cytochrome P450 4C1-like n=1 Tax=Spodoptera litura TaxID=69820 RepID=A0A9J7EQA5_SPOLT|nr:cytochrome P450 4C1-like [Spodoptera litura]